jgi:hypothetical protein
MAKMDQHFIDANNIVGKYLRDELTPEETIAFEEYLMDHPALIDELELDAVFIKAMPEAVKAMENSPKKTFLWFATPLRASFATLLVCLIALPMMLRMFDESGGAGQDDVEVMANIQHIFLTPMRGVGDGSRVPVITPSRVDRYFEVTVQTSDMNASEYQIDIINRKTRAAVLTPAVFSVMSTGDIKLALPSKAYQTGDYVLTATPMSGPSKPEKFYFSVRHE